MTALWKPPIDYARRIMRLALWQSCTLVQPGARVDTDTGWHDNPPTETDLPCLFLERGEKQYRNVGEGVAQEEGRFVLYLPWGSGATVLSKIRYPTGGPAYDVVYAPDDTNEPYQKLGLDPEIVTGDTP